MIRALTILVVLLLAVQARAQVYTVGKDGRARPGPGLTKSEQATLLPALRAVTDDDPDLFTSFSAFEEPLSERSKPAIVAISHKDCDRHSNCTFLVFRKLGSADVLLLDEAAADWDFKDSRHHGYRDIVLTYYMGYRQQISTWQFDGRLYLMSTCTCWTGYGTPDVKLIGPCGTP